jgi:AmmeMemoRadiSam system protein A
MDNISLDAKKILLKLARDVINYGVERHKILKITLREYPEELLSPKACFVTLNKNQQLRGCIGTLVARSPLVQEVVDSSFAAAFSDPRFPKVVLEELSSLRIYISVLTTAHKMNFTSEEDLLSQLRPNIDGLILKAPGFVGTFLPSVWEQLPNPIDFLKNLKLKAGLPINYWNDQIEILRYETEIFEE